MNVAIFSVNGESFARALIHFAFSELQTRHQSHFVIYRTQKFHNKTIALYRQVKFERSDDYQTISAANNELRMQLKFVLDEPMEHAESATTEEEQDDD